MAKEQETPGLTIQPGALSEVAHEDLERVAYQRRLKREPNRSKSAIAAEAIEIGLSYMLGDAK